MFLKTYPGLGPGIWLKYPAWQARGREFLSQYLLSKFFLIHTLKSLHHISLGPLLSLLECVFCLCCICNSLPPPNGQSLMAGTISLASQNLSESSLCIYKYAELKLSPQCDKKDPHYLQILLLQIFLLAEIYLSPQNQYSWCFCGCF